jgi:hypothetical protein
MTMAQSSVNKNKEDAIYAPPKHQEESHCNSTHSHVDDDLMKKPSEQKNSKRRKRNPKRKKDMMAVSKDSLLESDHSQIVSKRRMPSEPRSNAKKSLDDGVPVSHQPKNMGDDIDVDDYDDDDEDLLAAAAIWAGEKTDTPSDTVARRNRKEKTKKGMETVSESEGEQVAPPSTPDVSHLQSYSLHITQLPFDSSEVDLRKLFTEQGCTVTSVRLVYDHDVRGNKTVFRGVAFVEVSDQASYERALELNHKASLRGRKLNIRPTRSKVELANIVSRTKELVKEKIQRQRIGDVDGSTTSKSEKGKNNNTGGKHEDKSRSKAETQTSCTSKGEAKRVDAEGKVIKISKKQRNRRAAIIMGLKSKSKGSK